MNLTLNMTLTTTMTVIVVYKVKFKVKDTFTHPHRAKPSDCIPVFAPDHRFQEEVGEGT